MVIKWLIAGGAALAAIAPVAAVASAPAAADGSYASSAITSGRYAEAEHALKAASFSDAADPARLINIATVYARTDRLPDARTALVRVTQLPDEELTLQNGVAYSSHKIATVMLQRLDGVKLAGAQ